MKHQASHMLDKMPYNWDISSAHDTFVLIYFLLDCGGGGGVVETVSIYVDRAVQELTM